MLPRATKVGFRGCFMGEGPVVNVTATAGLYSQVAGVLAGLTFTGLLVYLSRRQAADDRQREDVMASSLFVAFVALTICAVVYAVFAGGLPNSGPAPIGLIV